MPRVPLLGMIADVDLEELRGFLAVAESGSFLAAATQLGVPRGTLRRRIDALEARAGALLLERTSRGVLLTAAGETLVARGRRLLDEGAALLAAVRASARRDDAPLRLRVPVGLPPEALVDFLQLAQRLSPVRRLQIQVCEDPLAQRDDLDLALVLGDAEPRAGWQLRELRQVEIRVLTSQSYIERNGCPQSLADLEAHPLAAWEAPQLDPCAWPLRTGPQAHVHVSPSLTTNDIHALHDFAARGLGLALVPDARLDLLNLPNPALRPVLAELIGAELRVQLAIAEASAEREHIERAATLIAEFGRELSQT